MVMRVFSPGGRTVGSVAFGSLLAFGPGVFWEASRTHRQMRLPSRPVEPITCPDGSKRMSSGCGLSEFAVGGYMRYHDGAPLVCSREMSMAMSRGNCKVGSPAIGCALR